MATYAIGDIQGCFDELILLLDKINFSDSDTLWIAGDLVNRGPKSLETLRYLKGLGDKAKIVLGNHDLHLLAVYYSAGKCKKSDTLKPILKANDCDELMHWLKAQPLAHYDSQQNTLMSHAGIPTLWSPDKTILLANEVSSMLKSDQHKHFFHHMYGNTPDQWHDNLSGMDRLRCITNFLTRMRFCYNDQRLDLSYKGEIGQQPKALKAWFEYHLATASAPTILFGHWAALMGNTGRNDIIALDTGCVWGEKLTAYCLETRLKTSINSLKPQTNH